ncbi:MAG: DUF4347 domain-containing protein, partial [Trichodesmium sp. MAG_R02]|nr:DUF4347 domain-containing protein [Trichodesmium sp. MAG_R02]
MSYFKIYQSVSTKKSVQLIDIPSQIESPQQIVFIDSNVDDYESLANGVLPGIKVVILDSSSDGFGQITRVIQKYPQISSIHIVSHGAPGCLYLGNSLLNVNNIDDYYSQKLEGWSVTNLFLYGCSVAAGDTGVKLLERIREITGASIAASARPTGNVALGGDWELEVVRGELEVDVPFTQETQQQWDYVLSQPIPFDDRPAVFQIKEGVIKEFNPLTTKFTEIANTNAITVNANINAAGFDKVNKYIYGFENSDSGTDHKLVAIGKDNIVHYVKTDGGFTLNSSAPDIYKLSPPTPSKILAGDVDDEQHLWVINTPDDINLPPADNVKLYKIYLAQPGDTTKTGEVKFDFSALNTRDVPEDIVYVQNEKRFYGIDTRLAQLIYDIDVSDAELITESGGTTVRPDRSATLRRRDNNNLIEEGVSYEAAWSGSEGGLYISNSQRVYHVVNFPQGLVDTTELKVEELVENTEGQSLKGTDGISTSHLKSVFMIPLMDLNGTQDSQNIIEDVNYATTFIEDSLAAKIVDNLAIKDYINNTQNNPENRNGTGLTRDRDRLTKATITLTNTFDGDDLVIGTLPASINQSKTGGVGMATIVTLTPVGTTASVEDFRDAITAIKFENTSENPETQDRIIEFELTDEDGNSSREIFVTGSNDVHTTTITVEAVNDPPSFGQLDNTPAFHIAGNPVILDSNATITDAELDSRDNYNGATLRLERNGGASTDDIFSSGDTGVLAALTDGGTLTVNGINIGTVTTNTGGILLLTFNNNATKSLVDKALQNIAYSNGGNTPGTITIDYTINDKNTGDTDQGTGGEKTGTGTIVVKINELPVAVNDTASTNKGQAVTFSIT